MPVATTAASHAALTPTRRLDPAAAAIELVDVHFAYDRREVLKGITMTVPRGKIVAIMGASGSGKTTILRLIGGQLKPASGEVRVGGQSVPDLEPDAVYALRRARGVLFQVGGVF